MTSDRLAIARRAARAGGTLALDRFRQTNTVETKAHKNDLVSDADRDAQERVVETIREESDAPIVGEEDETAGSVPDEGPAWVVDPIDGTANYLRGLRIWNTCVAAVDNGTTTAAATVLPALSDEYVAGRKETRLNGDPVTVSDRTDVETFAVAALGWGPHGERDHYADLSGELVQQCGDMRRFGSMQAVLAFVARGGVDAAVGTGTPNPWDSMAGVHLIRGAGGTVTDLDGTPWQPDTPGLVASNGEAHDDLLAIAREVTN